jgi:acyl-CoA synthetase (NDP forming)
MIGRLGPGTYVVEEFDGRPHVVELIVGAQRDPSFGPVVLVGAGGVLAELTRDTAVDLADLDRTAAHALLRRLECARLLDGWRGRPPVDVEALVDVVLAVATVIRARADVQSVELNPVRVAADGALAVDALVVTAGDERLTPAPRRSSAGGPGRPGSAAR